MESDSVLRWEKDIQRFDSLNLAEESGPETLLVTGSSSVRLWDSIHSDLAPFQVMQRGFGGATMADFNHYSDRIIKPHPFKAILVFVANDITGGENDRTPRELLNLYKILAGSVEERNPGTPLFWIETTPTPSRWDAWPEVSRANRMIEKYCSGNTGLYYIGTADAFLNEAGLPDSTLFRNDMLHLNRKGYRLWSEILLDALDRAGIQPSS